jgi:hypothetical protein
MASLQADCQVTAACMALDRQPVCSSEDGLILNTHLHHALYDLGQVTCVEQVVTLGGGGQQLTGHCPVDSDGGGGDGVGKRLDLCAQQARIIGWRPGQSNVQVSSRQQTA